MKRIALIILGALVGLPFVAQGRGVEALRFGAAVDSVAADTVPVPERAFAMTPAALYGTPAVFDHYRFVDSLVVPAVNPTGSIAPEALQWLDDELFRQEMVQAVKQGYMLSQPGSVAYNMSTLPEPPAPFRPTVDPRQHKFSFIPVSSAEAAEGRQLPIDVPLKNWINTFDASLQFSESYLSPNWYQGGNGNLNALGNVLWTIKLNPAFHPRLMFETSVQYKLALNTAPDDSLHSYSIAEDMFRINSKVGLKAWERWFYTVTLQFKTQMLNSYKKNTSDLMAAFMAPAELNVGLGMTYNYVNRPETLTFDASISPIAWNLKMCLNDRIPPSSLGIPDNRKFHNEIGTNLECKLAWKIGANVTYTSRLFTFTNYRYVQGDWENTLQFDFNRYLSTKLFWHLRYDSSTRPAPEAEWRYWQLKEILSIGFSYSFTTGVS